MGILNKVFGYRWSLYIVRNGNQIAYAMHENSPMRMVGYVMGYFAGGAEPKEPWSLILNFNHKHQTIILRSAHFTADGGNVTRQLVQEVEAIDADWDAKGGEPIFEEAATKRRLKISDHVPGNMDIQAMLAQIDKPRDATLFSVLGEVFGKK